MLICIGELLVDIFDDGDQRTALPGGAPFNVACNALLYTSNVAFVGAVGQDEYGKMLTDFAKSKPFKKLNIKQLLPDCFKTCDVCYEIGFFPLTHS